ncbi:hypothetical protein K9N50_12715 [bacterium]|nr:hypothetical protein [bacterium]
MTELLAKAFNEISQLPEKDQEEFAAFLLEELASENRWHTLLSTSAETLEQLARETEREIEAGETSPLNVGNE